MSRLEDALEKALKLREETGVQKHDVPVRGTAPSGRRESAHFEVRHPIVDASKLDSRLVTVVAPNSVAAEQYRKLRAKVVGATRDKFKNTILVTSAEVGDGKTTTSVNLAITLAQGLDHTVLLVDADLRRPSVHKILGLNPAVGLSDYLQGKASLEDVLIHTGLGKLVVLPAGTIPDNPAELLASNYMQQLIQEIKYRYKDRYIVFDTSPILVTSDAIPIARQIDGVVLVIQAEKTSPATAKKMVAALGSAQILGAVFNSVPELLIRASHPYYTYSYDAPPERSPEHADHKRA